MSDLSQVFERADNLQVCMDINKDHFLLLSAKKGL